MNIQKVLLKVLRAIRDFIARHIDSGVARESKKASCAALRSNASRNASRKSCGSCTSRALLSLFVASATLLATFVIAPAYALSAGENTGESATSTEKVEGAKSGSAKSEGEKQNPEQSESINTEPNKKNNGSSYTLKNNNKESNPVEKPKTAGNNGVDKAKSTDSAVKKNAKDVQKKDASAYAVKGTDRGATGGAELPEVCKNNKRYSTFAKCYVIRYYNGDSVIDDGNNPILVQRGSAITIKPKFEIKSTKKPADMPGGLRFQLEKYNNRSDPVPSWANFEKEENGKTIKFQNTENQTGFDGSITLRPNGKWDYGIRRFKVFAYHNNEKIYTKISVKVDVSDVQNDLSLSLYDFGNKQDSTEVSGNKITINPKPKDSTPSGGTAGSDDKKDVYDSINKLFIDSKSTKKPTSIYHHMICKTGSDDNASYTVDSVNGLSLKDKKDNPSADKQIQFKHVENNKPTSGSDKYSVYLDDLYTERSQSWISGTPAKAGTFVCKVFAIKDVDYNLQKAKQSKHNDAVKITKHFNEQISNADGIKNLFNNPDSLNSFTKDNNIYSADKNIDWAYESVTIEVKSSKPPKPNPPEIGDNDLTLKVYPFKNSDGSLPAELPDKNNKISAILGMSLKPFVDATSAADSTKKITLRVLCSKGEKKNAAGSGGTSTGGAGSAESGSAVGDSNGANTVSGSTSSAQSGSQPAQPSESTQPAEDPEYKTWSSNLAELGLSVPPDDNQNTCHSNKEGETTCKSSDPSKKVAARTDKEVSIKPAAVGDYQCVVFALKPDALTKFDDVIKKTKADSLTPDSIKSALTTASSTAAPTAFKEHKDFAAFTLNIHSVINFTLPHTGGQSWNLQLGILAALLVNLLAAGFVVNQSERGRKLILVRWRGLCNHV